MVCAQRVNRSLPSHRRTQTLASLLPTRAMFGGATSCRKEFGVMADHDLPSVRSQMTRNQNGTTELCTLGPQLISRSGKSLSQLWAAMAAGFGERIPNFRIPERLSAAGAGILGPRELGQLQRTLQPAADGAVGFEEWAAAFGLTPERDFESSYGGSVAGMSTRQSQVQTLPHFARQDSAGAPAAPVAAPSHERWPGGFIEADIEQDITNRLYGSATSAVKRGRIPFHTDDDKSIPEPGYWTQPSNPTPLSTTFSSTINRPPFATGEPLKPCERSSVVTCPPYAIGEPLLALGSSNASAQREPPFATNY